MKYSGAQLIVKILEYENVEYITGIPGGFNLPIYDALYESKIKHILVRHEQAAGFIAQGISRTSNKVGVCITTSGPGVTNLLTAIADAKLDSIPLIALTGQVTLNAIGTDAFQEVDAYGLTIPITKHNFLVKNINDLFWIIPEAFKIALDGRKGPVLIDIPKNIQTETIEIDDIFSKINKKDSDIIHNLNCNSKAKIESISPSTLKCIAELLNNSKKPIIYAGGGIISSNSSQELYKISTLNNIPVAVSLMGLGCFPSNSKLYIGMLGMHGAPYTNYLINEADLILAFGIRFDDRATGRIDKFCPNATIVHVDIDPSEINKIKNSNLSIVANINYFFNKILKYIEKNSRDNWIKRVECYKSKYPLTSYEDKFHPSNIIPYISTIVPTNTIVCTDVGEHQMWVAQRYPFNIPKTLLTSGGLGTMGFGLPSSIGAALINKDKTILCFSGDGSILMNLQELATLSENNLNVKIIILTNHHLGLVRQQQELFYNKHYIASHFKSNPNFKKIAEGFGIIGCNLNDEKSPYEKLNELLNNNGPCLINIEIKEDENVFPMVEPGKSNIEMLGCD